MRLSPSLCGEGLFALMHSRDVILKEVILKEVILKEVILKEIDSTIAVPSSAGLMITRHCLVSWLMICSVI